MAHAHHDSSFELTLLPVGGGDTFVPNDLPQKVNEIPMLELDSTGPLPTFDDVQLPTIETRIPDSPSLAAMSLPSSGNRRAPGSLWLQGDVLMCPCPDCHAPMSVRTWLMVADCWKCSTSIELTEEQEREARRLLREREQSQRKVAGARQNGHATEAREEHRNGHVPGDVVTRPSPPPSEETRSRSASQQSPAAEPHGKERGEKQSVRRRRKRNASARPVGARAKIRKMAVAGSVRVWLADMFGNMPAWLVSFVFHVVMLIILNLLLMSDDQQEPEMVLVTELSTERKDGGDTEAQLAKDVVEFDLPVPNPSDLKDAAKREVLLKADQEARQLRLDPNDPTTDLPRLEKVESLLRSTDSVRRTFAARDPRLRVEMVKAEGGTTLTEAAVARALRFLAKEQNEDGGWGRSLRKSEPAGTSLALLPFLGAGQTHQTGIYKDNVAMGLRWLIQHQAEDGDLRHSLKDNSGMYAHGQGAIVLSEAYALTGDEQLRGPAQKAIDFIVEAQHTGGGWRYKPGEAGDTSVLGWQLMALHSARVSGLMVPDATVELAGNYLDTVQSAGGAKYAYRRGTGPNAAMCAEGLLCRMYSGWTKDNPALEQGMELLLKDHKPRADRRNIYYWYYGTQVAHHIGGEPWEEWNNRMRGLLVESQIDSGRFAGAWRPNPGGGDHSRGDDWIYTTSLATCCLEVYYRHAPLFRQIELEDEALASP